MSCLLKSQKTYGSESSPLSGSTQWSVQALAISANAEILNSNAQPEGGGLILALRFPLPMDKSLPAFQAWKVLVKYIAIKRSCEFNFERLMEESRVGMSCKFEFISRFLSSAW